MFDTERTFHNGTTWIGGNHFLLFAPYVLNAEEFTDKVRSDTGVRVRRGWGNRRTKLQYQYHSIDEIERLIPTQEVLTERYERFVKVDIEVEDGSCYPPNNVILFVSTINPFRYVAIAKRYVELFDLTEVYATNGLSAVYDSMERTSITMILMPCTVQDTVVRPAIAQYLEERDKAEADALANAQEGVTA